MAFNEDQINYLKLLLDVQSEAYKQNLKILHDDIKELKRDYNEQINDLKHSLEFSQSTIDELQKKVKDLETETKDVSKQDIEIKDLRSKISRQEDYSRRINIKLDGIGENENETYEQTIVKVQKILKDKLELGNISIDIAHRLPSAEGTKNRQPRTILARLSKLSDRNAVFRYSWKLKNSGIWINEDLCEETINMQKLQRPKLIEARNSGKIAYFRGSKLVIKEKLNKSKMMRSDMSFTPPPTSRGPLTNVFSPHLLRSPAINDSRQSEAAQNENDQMPKQIVLRPRFNSQSKAK